MSDAEGFFSRWSRRKAERRDGGAKPIDAPPGNTALDAPHEAGDRGAGAPVGVLRGEASPPASGAPQVPAAAQPARGVAPPPAPTLDDVASLTPASDFARFVAPGVDASVQHAALRKLFSDPHFNVMDGLDTYIGDYNTPNPIPKAMLERLVQARTMRLFDAPPQQAGVAAASAAQLPDTAAVPAAPQAGSAAAPRAREAGRAVAAFPDGANAPALPQSAAANETASTGPDTDEDFALRLQPDDAADAAGAGPHRAGPRA